MMGISVPSLSIAFGLPPVFADATSGHGRGRVNAMLYCGVSAAASAKAGLDKLTCSAE
jgi:hypothetical protein